MEKGIKKVGVNLNLKKELAEQIIKIYTHLLLDAKTTKN